MKLTSRIIVIILAGAMLQGCDGSRQSTGLIAGAAAGGLLGSRFGKGEGQIALAGLGALAGAIAGGAIGRSLDDNDKKIAELSSQKALEAAPAGSSVEWHNPDSGHKGRITPTNTYRDTRGQYCREYTHIVTIGNEEQEIYGTACRQPEGNWETIDTEKVPYGGTAAISQENLDTAPIGTRINMFDRQGRSDTIRPTNNRYRGHHGQYCREYTRTISVGNEEQEIFGTACRQPDGQWRIIN